MWSIAVPLSLAIHFVDFPMNKFPSYISMEVIGSVKSYTSLSPYWISSYLNCLS